MLSDGAVGVHVSRALPWGARVVKQAPRPVTKTKSATLAIPAPWPHTIVRLGIAGMPAAIRPNLAPAASESWAEGPGIRTTLVP